MAFAFLGTALAWTSELATAGLGGVLAALVVPILGGWAAPARLGALAHCDDT